MNTVIGGEGMVTCPDLSHLKQRCRAPFWAESGQDIAVVGPLGNDGVKG